MKRQVLTAALTLTFLVNGMSAAFAQYVDQSAYTNAVVSLSSAGVIDGGGNVRLNDRVNRAEALKIILLAQNKYALEVEKTRASLPPLSLFPDVVQSEWYAPYVETGFRFGLIKGYPDGTFFPQGGVKVAEAVAMVTRAYGEPTASAPFLSSADLPNQPNQWYAGNVSVALSRNAVMPGSRLEVGNYMTRGQLFDLVYRMREVHLQNVASFGGPAAQTTNAVQLSVNGGAPPAPVSGAVQATASAQFASQKPFAISIPSIGIVDLTITHPSDPFTQNGVLKVLQTGVGHLFAYPGKGSKVMIYGHSSGYPWDLSQFTKIFRTINEVQEGAMIYVTYEGKLHVYRVSQKRTIDASDKTAFEPDDKGEQLILYTCWPPDSIAQRLLVYAVPVETIALR